MIDHYLIYVPHADDELINMAWFTFKENSTCVLVSGAENERTGKFKSVMEHLSKDYYLLPFHPDALLSYDKNFVYVEMKRAYFKLKESLKKNSIVGLVLPSVFDTHPEHTLITAMGSRIALIERTPITYTSSRHVEEHEVVIPNKFHMIEYYYPEEFKSLIQTNYGLDTREYHSDE